MGFVSCQRSKIDSTFISRKQISPLDTTRNKLRFPFHSLHQHAGSFRFPNLRAFDDTVDVIDVLFSEEVQTTFEPQVNTPALFSFLFIVVTYSLLQLRINGVRDAADRRKIALESLRIVKSAQFSEINKPSEEEVIAAETLYRNALTDELDLRTIIPGVRIAAPNDPQKKEEDIAAAKQFLGIDLSLPEDEDNDGGRIFRRTEGNGEDGMEKERRRLLLQSRRRSDDKSVGSTSSGKEEEEEEEGISTGGKLILLVVALSQIFLLFVLSFDPMKPPSTTLF